MDKKSKFKLFKMNLSCRRLYKIRLKMFDNQKELYKIIYNCHPKNDEEIIVLKEIAEAYNDTNERLKKSIEAKIRWYS